jgi:GTPase
LGEETLTKQVNIKLQIFDCKNIISAGFSCIVHFMSSDIPIESEIMIEKLIGKPFAKKGDTIDIICTLKSPSNIRKRSKILFRSSDITIGCGIVLD